MPDNILEELFDQKRLKILKLFIGDKNKQFYLREISKAAQVPVASTARILGRLVKLNLVSLVKIKRFKLYQLNKGNPNLKYLESFLREEKRILDMFVDAVKELPGVQSIIQHGEANKDRANLLILGENIDQAELKRIVGEIKEKYKFTVSYLTLAREQFQQMSKMGLYSGEKKVLYEKQGIT